MQQAYGLLAPVCPAFLRTCFVGVPPVCCLDIGAAAEYVSMVVTEFGMIPPSSVPVILREFSESAQLE